jgi:hypothetical protein
MPALEGYISIGRVYQHWKEAYISIGPEAERAVDLPCN